MFKAIRQENPRLARRNFPNDSPNDSFEFPISDCCFDCVVSQMTPRLKGDARGGNRWRNPSTHHKTVLCFMVFYGDFMDFQIFQITTEHQMSETQGRFDDLIS
jgi:hypothetical protein